MKKMTTGLLLWALAFSLPAQEPREPAADVFKRLERWKFELPDSIKMEEMQARLKELQTRLLSENRLHEEQAKLARKYAEQAVVMQKSLAESPQWRSDLAKMQFDLQKGLALAGLYKDRMLEFIDEAQMEQHKQIMALESKCLDLSSLYKESRDAEKQKKIEQELEEAVTQLFDLREGQREKDIQRLEKDLAQMKKKLEERRMKKSQIVGKRLSQLMGRSEELEW